MHQVVRVEGLTAALGALQAVGLDLDDLDGALSVISEEAAASVARHVPRRTGRLAGSVRPGRARAKAFVVAGGPAAPYAGRVNYVTGPSFMQAADADMRPKAIRRLEQEINTAIRRRGLNP